MKRFLTGAFFTALLSGSAVAQSGVLIKGKWERRNEGTLTLYSLNNNRLEEVSNYKLAKGPGFGFYFQPSYEGFYVIGTGGNASQMDKYSFYLKPGDELNFEVNDSACVLTGKNTAENKELEKWNRFAFTIERKGIYFNKTRSTYIDFLPDLERVADAAATYKAGKTGNKRFDANFATYRQLSFNGAAVMFLSTPRTAHPETKDLTAFYRNMRTADFTGSTSVLQYPFAMRTLTGMARIESRLKGHDRPELEEKLGYFLNDTLKGEIVLEDAAYLKSYVGYQDMEKKYGRYIITADQQARAKAIVAKFANDAKAGSAAFDFTYPDLEGKKVSLSDFKGRVVLVDVWATWCGPCKAEIPALKAMEQEMHNKDIVFMSVSVDEAKDQQKWKDFVAKEELKGVQLFAGGWSEITKYYNIKGIPRFMVFDKKGNIVTIDAPRPSSPELKLLLEAELKK